MNQDTLWFITEMDMMRARFRAFTQKEPTGWIMGIEQYQLLANAIMEQVSAEQRKRMGRLDYFQGLPVIIKATPGVELAMEMNEAKKFRKHRNDMRQQREELT